MTREELIDNMVSCYDNGDAMLEYVEEYYAQQTCETCKCYDRRLQNSELECSAGVEIDKSIVPSSFGCNKWKDK